MKKLMTLIICILLIGLQTSLAFADFYVIDPFTDDIISAEDDYGEKNKSIGVVSVSSNCVYDVTQRIFIFSSSGYSLTSNTCDGEYTTDEVNLKANADSGFYVYKDGEGTLISGNAYFNDPGNYAVRDISGQRVMEFTILGSLCSDVYSYYVPSVYRISSVRIDSEAVPSGGSSIDFDAEGLYEINLYNKITERSKTLKFKIDRTPPELEINGVVDGEAWQTVTFGEREDGSTLEVYRDSTLITQTEEYKIAGSYKVIYTDAAGNSNIYNFTIHVFLDISAWFAVGFVAALIIAALAYMMYWRKNTRVG